MPSTGFPEKELANRLVVHCRKPVAIPLNHPPPPTISLDRRRIHREWISPVFRQPLDSVRVYSRCLPDFLIQGLTLGNGGLKNLLSKGFIKRIWEGNWDSRFHTVQLWKSKGVKDDVQLVP